jgi:polar amino acid transport system substrate-binding protein
MKRPAIVFVAVLAAGAVLGGGCASQSSDASHGALNALTEPSTTTPPTTTTVPCTHQNFLESFRPLSPLPAPGNMPENTLMRAIQDDKVLKVAVDENTPHLAERVPATNRMEGLEIELVRAIAEAITGNPDAVEYTTVVTKDKNRVVADGTVDLTASADSMTCERWNEVSFSTEYLTAFHQLLVRSDSGIQSEADLAGRSVCVTAGSSSVKLLTEIAPRARRIEVPARNDCLVALQEADADAYLGHDTFIRGMHEQDLDNTRIVQRPNREQHYGIAISKDHPEMVAFVNAVLEQMRADGRLAALYQTYLGENAPPIPEPHYPS